jgi:hypothetical protein
MVVWIQNNFLSGHEDRRFNGYVPVDSDVLPPNTTRDQLMIWGYCSMLLGVKYSGQNTIGFGGTIYNYAGLVTLAQKLRAVDLGQPLSDYYKIASTSVYARDFAGGKVLVNPTGASYTVTLDGNYTTFDGSIGSSSLTVNNYTGVILIK